ncbi:uncharacterized protein LOC126377890 [Pectinophora gossypiella]|uniref:uncharacterized protein LOC126377890 n=1 Tax=Pectinophora gossypiella TaxID=13191 RepID=UPI00214F091D|nr:uncharacterized protein LOC126377890 [Pectinophora gossypiella]
MAADPHQSTSAMNYAFMSPDVYNVKFKETMHIISRVVQQCTEEQSNTPLPCNDYLQRASKYTGFDTKMLAKYANSDDPHVILKYQEADRNIIYQELSNFYLNKKIMPTTRQLFDALYEKIPVYIDIRNFRKLLVKMGYAWKEIVPYGLVIMEKPAVTYERYHYLKKIMEYRKEELPIFFVDLRCENGKKAGPLYFLYAVSKCSIQAIDTYEFNQDLNFEKWVEKSLLPIIPPNSVIVMHNAYYNNEQIRKVPTINSYKQDMIEWLEYNNIPCSRSLSKTELYTLVEKYTNCNEKLYKSDVLIKNHGHKVLRIPKCIKEVAPTRLVSEAVTKTVLTKNPKIITTLLQDIPMDWLKKYDQFIAEQERIIFENDMKIDSIIDDLCETMKRFNTKADPDSDLPSCSDSE